MTALDRWPWRLLPIGNGSLALVDAAGRGVSRPTITASAVEWTLIAKALRSRRCVAFITCAVHVDLDDEWTIENPSYGGLVKLPLEHGDELASVIERTLRGDPVPSDDEFDRRCGLIERTLGGEVVDGVEPAHVTLEHDFDCRYLALTAAARAYARADSSADRVATSALLISAAMLVTAARVRLFGGIDEAIPKTIESLAGKGVP